MLGSMSDQTPCARDIDQTTIKGITTNVKILVINNMYCNIVSDFDVLYTIYSL